MHELAASVGDYPTSADPATGSSVNAVEVVTSTASGSGAVVTSTESGYVGLALFSCAIDRTEHF